MFQFYVGYCIMLVTVLTNKGGNIIFDNNKKIILRLLLGIFVICSMLSSCGKTNKNIDTDADILESPSSEQVVKVEYVEGKAGIENVTIEDGKINFQIRNLTTDNILLTAYLEYVRLENKEETGHYSLDCEGINIAANDIGDMVSFDPQKPLGNEGIIKIKVLVFENEKDNYNRE